MADFRTSARSLAWPSIRLQWLQRMPRTRSVWWQWSTCQCFPAVVSPRHIPHCLPCDANNLSNSSDEIPYALIRLEFLTVSWFFSRHFLQAARACVGFSLRHLRILSRESARHLSLFFAYHARWYARLSSLVIGGLSAVKTRAYIGDLYEVANA